jgi:hypothetical protein
MFCAGGCTTTGEIRKRAANLSADIDTYRTQQGDRVDRFNQQYRDRFNQLMDDLVQLEDRQLQQGRDVDAQALADSLIADGKATLVGVLRSSFANALKNQRAAVASADDAITAARADYVKSYTEVKLDLAKLDAIQKDLEILATKEAWGDVLQNATGIIQNVVKTRNDLLKQEKKDAKSNAQTSTD